MQHYKYIILGAGPSGLAFAHALLSHGEKSFLVLEKESSAGGLCRSEMVDGAPLDIGGGHFLDVKRKEVLELLFKFMPRGEWQEHVRSSAIKLRGNEIDYPLEANLWQLPIPDQVDFLESIAQAGCVQGLPMPEVFDEWIAWKLGNRIADEYMLPYNRKIWSVDLRTLGTYWLYKLPDVSFRETLQSCLERRAHGALPAHGRFLYPKRHGYGEVWTRMAQALGNQLRTSTPATNIDVNQRTINSEWSAETIVTTIPWTVWNETAELPDYVTRTIERLRFSSIDVDYFPQTLETRAHWVYDPDENTAHHRLLCRSNFCAGSRGYWTETNSSRSAAATSWRYRNVYAYPLNTRDKPESITQILDWARSHSIIGLGRWGRWEHMNSDVAVFEAIALAQQLVAA